MWINIHVLFKPNLSEFFDGHLHALQVALLHIFKAPNFPRMLGGENLPVASLMSFVEN